MVRPQRMHISFLGLLGWVVPVGALVGAAGLWPTWHLAGEGGLRAQAWAGGIALAAVVASAAVVMGYAAGGPARAAFAFLAAGLVRLALCLSLALAARWLWDLPEQPLLIWVGVFYAAMLLAEAYWLARALNRDADRVSLGQVRRTRRAVWDRHRIR